MFLPYSSWSPMAVPKALAAHLLSASLGVFKVSLPLFCSALYSSSLRALVGLDPRVAGKRFRTLWPFYTQRAISTILVYKPSFLRSARPLLPPKTLREFLSSDCLARRCGDVLCAVPLFKCGNNFSEAMLPCTVSFDLSQRNLHQY